MEPYQKASERLRQRGESTVNLAKNIGLTALGGGAAKFGTQAISKLIPGIMAFVNKYVPENIAVKGLEKLDPRFGKLIQGAMSDGYSFSDIKQFLGDKIEKTEESKDDRNIIEQESPELHQFMIEEIKKGRKPIQAGAIAQHDKRFSEIINNLSKSHKLPWSQILASVYGNEEMAQPNQQQQAQSAQSLQQSQQQPSKGQQAIIQALQEATEARKRRKQPKQNQDPNLPVYYDIQR
jgi:hypothetical protein